MCPSCINPLLPFLNFSLFIFPICSWIEKCNKACGKPHNTAICILYLYVMHLIWTSADSCVQFFQQCVCWLSFLFKWQWTLKILSLVYSLFIVDVPPTVCLKYIHEGTLVKLHISHWEFCFNYYVSLRKITLICYF